VKKVPNCLLFDPAGLVDPHIVGQFVSQTGARLHIEGSLVGLDFKEFFLLLSSTGLAAMPTGVG
jgi:hypothetical protein